MTAIFELVTILQKRLEPTLALISMQAVCSSSFTKLRWAIYITAKLNFTCHCLWMQLWRRFSFNSEMMSTFIIVLLVNERSFPWNTPLIWSKIQDLSVRSFCSLAIMKLFDIDPGQHLKCRTQSDTRGDDFTISGLVCLKFRLLWLKNLREYKYQNK